MRGDFSGDHLVASGGSPHMTRNHAGRTPTIRPLHTVAGHDRLVPLSGRVLPVAGAGVVNFGQGSIDPDTQGS